MRQGTSRDIHAGRRSVGRIRDCTFDCLRGRRCFRWGALDGHPTHVNDPRHPHEELARVSRVSAAVAADELPAVRGAHELGSRRAYRVPGAMATAEAVAPGGT